MQILKVKLNLSAIQHSNITANPIVGAVVVAAGQSNRMSGIDKVFTSIVDRPLITHTVSCFEQSPLIDSIVLVLSKDQILAGRALGVEERWSKVVAICEGGSKRQDSVFAGLANIESCDWVVVHDGARPCVTVDLIARGLTSARETGSSAAAVQVTDTIKMVSNNGLIESTVSRDGLFLIQTPQVFRYEILKDAHGRASGIFSDDSSMVESAGYKVRIFEGDPDNIKVTNKRDIVKAASIIFTRNQSVCET